MRRYQCTAIDDATNGSGLGDLMVDEAFLTSFEWRAEQVAKAAFLRQPRTATDPMLVSGVTLPLGADPALAVVPADNTLDASDPTTADKIELGRRLFEDVTLSSTADVACASCHQEDKAFTDGLPKAVGINAQEGGRNTPTILGALFRSRFFCATSNTPVRTSTTAASIRSKR